MAFTATSVVSRIDIYPGGVPSLVIEHTWSILQDGVAFSDKINRQGYDITAPGGKAALTQALSDAGLSNITIT